MNPYIQQAKILFNQDIPPTKDAFLQFMYYFYGNGPDVVAEKWPCYWRQPDYRVDGGAGAWGMTKLLFPPIVIPKYVPQGERVATGRKRPSQ